MIIKEKRAVARLRQFQANIAQNYRVTRMVAEEFMLTPNLKLRLTVSLALQPRPVTEL